MNYKTSLSICDDKITISYDPELDEYLVEVQNYQGAVKIPSHILDELYNEAWYGCEYRT